MSLSKQSKGCFGVGYGPTRDARPARSRVRDVGQVRPTADIRNSNEHRQQSTIVSVSINLIYAEIIFTKMVCHAISLRRISPTFQNGSNPELWDIGAACAIARTLVESFDALAYIAL
jgi:hypothetical protein